MNSVIDIQTITEYLGVQEGKSRNNVHVFSYTMNITNTGKSEVELISRYWLITNGNGEKTEVEGEGVVGEQPIIGPNKTYTYTSASMLKTEVGTMEGYYIFRDTIGSEFKVAIPLFSLSVPNSVH